MKSLDEMKLQRAFGVTPGQALQHQGLNSLANWAHDHRHPALTGLIVEQDGYRPSGGYWELYKQQIKDSGVSANDWWDDQIRKTLDFDWGPYIGEGVRPFEPPVAEDIGDPDPVRVKFVSTRIVRDTRVTERVKGWYKNRCQICNDTFMIDKTRSYAEGHHIHPLGAEEPGPDVVENVLCVCPGCHVRLDFRGIPLIMEELLVDGRHKIGKQYIEYHNKNIFTGTL